MTDTGVSIFGEVLFDCFPGGERVLGGAPFNVAWHLHFLGDCPRLISRVGDDELGREILAHMGDHGMYTGGIQVDPLHPTGQVAVSFQGDEPQYDIREGSAFDFIETAPADGVPEGILYHGTLSLRHETSRRAFFRLLQANPALSLFIDVNLRAPWWEGEMVRQLLERARWCKLNHHELQMLGFEREDEEESMEALRRRFDLEQVILTRGEAGAVVLDQSGGVHRAPPSRPERFVDTVGAGDAFSGVYIHGLRDGWNTADTLRRAQDFAARVIGIRGATVDRDDFYSEFR